MEDLEVGRSGGDAILAWLKGNAAALRSRPESAPVFVLRDWDDSLAAQFETALRPHNWSHCLTCPVAIVNPELDDSFRGIERYLPTPFIRAHAGVGLLSPAGAAVPLSMRPSARPSIKQRLAASFLAPGVSAGPFLVDLAKWLDDQVESAIGAIPAEAFTAI